jgi:predicted small lipoprotein YifL
MIRGPAMRALLPFLLLLAFLNGCGFKGPLYLPEEKSAPASRDVAPRQE